MELANLVSEFLQKYLNITIIDKYSILHIENEIKHNINIKLSKTFKYESSNNYAKKIMLYRSAGKIKITEKFNDKKLFVNIKNKTENKKIVFYSYYGNNNDIVTYYGNQAKREKSIDFSDFRCIYRLIDKADDLISEYNEYMRDISHIFTITKGKINLFAYGFIPKCGNNFFNQ